MGTLLLQKRGTAPPPTIFGLCLFWPNSWVDQDVTGMEVGLDTGDFVLVGDPAPQKWSPPQFSAHVCCGQTAGWIKMPLGTEVGLGPSHIVLDEDPAAPMERGTTQPGPPTFRHVYCCQTVAYLSNC